MGLILPQEAEMSLSMGYCDFTMPPIATFTCISEGGFGRNRERSSREVAEIPPKQRPNGTDGSPPLRECDGVARLRVVEELAPVIKLRLVPRPQPSLHWTA
jgi:hypothetical protein